MRKGIPLIFLVFFHGNVQGQKLTGFWEGALSGTHPDRLVMQINEDNDKKRVTLFSIDQDGEPWLPDSVDFKAGHLVLILDSGRAGYDGMLADDGASIRGV